VKILIVEDNPVNAEMVRLSLEKEQYDTVLALDGEEALAKLEEHPEIDLVITDVMMPNVGGLEMLQRIRQRPEWKMLPVVVATSLANQATVRQAVSLHCKHFIVKPFTVKLLVQTVREAIGQRGVVLQEKTRVLGRLGLDPDGYDQLALTFSTFVHERVGALRALCEPAAPAESGEQAAPAEPANPPQLTEIDLPMRRDLFALEESATLLGAERLGNLLVALGLPNGTLSPEALGGAYKALLTELRLLVDALPPPKKGTRLVDDNGDGAGESASEAVDEPAS
jgi:CheY-like chemotaxis protein